MTETEAFRRQMPPPLAPRPLKLPEHLETTLANGLGLVVVEDKRSAADQAFAWRFDPVMRTIRQIARV